jgi:hypothetical protein
MSKCNLFKLQSNSSVDDFLYRYFPNLVTVVDAKVSIRVSNTLFGHSSGIKGDHSGVQQNQSLPEMTCMEGKTLVGSPILFLEVPRFPLSIFSICQSA